MATKDKKPTDEALATLMLDRQERVQKCAKEIEEACKTNRVNITVPIAVVDGRLVGQVQLVAMD